MTEELKQLVINWNKLATQTVDVGEHSLDPREQHLAIGTGLTFEGCAYELQKVLEKYGTIFSSELDQ